MTSPLAAKATFNRHAACEMGKKQKQFSCRNVTSSILQYLSPCPATIPFFSGWHWPRIMVSFHITPAIFFRCPRTWPFLPTAQLAMLTLHFQIQLMGGVLLCWEEPWAWGEIWHTPAAPQGCSRKEPLSPHKAPRAGYMSHMPLSVTDSHCKVSAAPCAAGGEIREGLGHCCEAVRTLSSFLASGIKLEVKQCCLSCANKSGVHMHPLMISRLTLHCPVCRNAAGVGPLCLQMCESVLHSLCTDVNDYMRCEAVENQAPEGFLQDGK